MISQNHMKKLALIIGTLALPLVSFAQLQNITNNIITPLGTIVNALIPILFAVALLAFFWGLVKYIFGKGEDKEQAKKTMIWGVVALFVMASIWGLVRFIQTAVGVTDNSDITVPGVKKP